jgi:hypothetical protein
VRRREVIIELPERDFVSLKYAAENLMMTPKQYLQNLIEEHIDAEIPSHPAFGKPSESRERISRRTPTESSDSSSVPNLRPGNLDTSF